MMRPHRNRVVTLVAALSACALAAAVAPSAHADDAAPITDLATAAATVGDADGETSAGEPDAATATTFEAKLRWQSRSFTDYWYRNVDADGRRTSTLQMAIEMEHPLSDDWRLWAQIDGLFDAHDTHWSSSETDSIAFVAALRHDIGAGFELEVGGRYDDWVNLHAAKGDPWGPYAMISCTFDAFCGELSPYIYHELRNYIDGSDHDGTWISEIGAEWEMPLSDDWTLKVAALGGRIDGSRTDPDAWGLVAETGLAWQWSEDTSIGVSVGIDHSAGADVPSRGIGFVAVELTFSF
ncbi:MAG: hypothetical protein K8T90_22275 [Planctomycetes bacterium]|nr:hypothetical protein [Planctomycetota bacterium]